MRYFASWSSDVGDDADYKVYLYSNQPGVDPIPFILCYEQIHEYIVKRYSLLSNIVRAITEKNRLFSNDKRQVPIKRNTDIVEQLNILLDENSVRIRKGDGYHYQITELIELFTAPQEFLDQNKEAVQYLHSLETLVDEIYNKLQNMRCDELVHGHLLDSKFHKYRDLFYDLSKVFEYLNNPFYHSSMVDHHLNRLKNAGLLPQFVSRKTDKRDLKLLLMTSLVKTSR